MQNLIKQYPDFYAEPFTKCIYNEPIISNYGEAKFIPTFRNFYCIWKYGKPKHNYYVRNRRSNNMVLDYYDQYIIDNLNSGSTITYDAAGYYLDGAVDNLTVVELNPIVTVWYPQAIIDTGEASVKHLYYSADNFIVNNTIKLRWKTFNDYTDYWVYQQRFLKPGCQIFFSFRDIFIFHNRLKYRFSDLLRDWLDTMSRSGFKLVKLTHDLIDIDKNLTSWESAPEVSDMVNGNIKIHWEYCPVE